MGNPKKDARYYYYNVGYKEGDDKSYYIAAVVI
jgi:hypothetical protein